MLNKFPISAVTAICACTKPKPDVPSHARRNDPCPEMCQSSSFNLVFGNFLTLCSLTCKATPVSSLVVPIYPKPLIGFTRLKKSSYFTISVAVWGPILRKINSGTKSFFSRELRELTLQDPWPPGSAVISVNEYNFIHSPDLWALILDRDPIRGH